jgi:N-acetylneuraminic acid mutarotase
MIYSLDDDEESIVLNVGGTEFTTTREVLRAQPGTYFTGSMNFKQVNDPIPRSPQYFAYVLAYLTDGSLPSTASLETLVGLKADFEFYSIELPPALPQESIILVDNRVTRIDVLTGFKHDISSTTVLVPRHDGCVVQSMGGKIYRTGGGSYYNVERYDPPNDRAPHGDKWVSIPDTNFPQVGPLAATTGNYLYVLCVDDENGWYALERYSAESNKWELLPHIEVSMEVGAMCAVGSDIYVFTGADMDVDDGIYRIYKFDTLEKTWGTIADCVVPHSLGGNKYSTAVVDGMIYITDQKDGNRTFCCFDPTQHTLTQLAPRTLSLFPSHKATLLPLNGYLHCIRRDRIESYDVDRNQWTTVSTSKIIGAETNCLCVLQTDIPTFKTILDNWIAHEVDNQLGRLKSNVLQSIASENSSQCDKLYNAGERCGNTNLCRSRHDTVFYDVATMIDFAEGHRAYVSTEALLHIPRSVMTNLDKKRFDLRTLLCVQNVLRKFPVKSPPTFLCISLTTDPHNFPTKMQILSRSVSRGQWIRLNASGFHNVDAGYHSFQGSMYATGGQESRQNTTTVMKCSMVNELWEQCPPMILARCKHVVAVVNSKMYVIGGDAGTRASMEMFDGETWTQVASVPTQLFGRPGCTVIDSKIYLFNLTSYYKPLLIYDVETNVWTSIPRTSLLPIPLLNETGTHLSSNFIDGTIYIKGERCLVVYNLTTSTFGNVQRDDLGYRCVIMGGKLYGSCSTTHKLSVYNVEEQRWIPTVESAPGILTTWTPLEPPTHPWVESEILEKTKEQAKILLFDGPLG